MASRTLGIRAHAFGAVVACFVAAVGCGNDSDDGVRSTTASGGTSAGSAGDAAAGTNAGGTSAGSGATGGGATGGSGGASGGSGGATGGSGGTVGGSMGGSASTDSGAVSCSGEWSPSREVMAAPAGGYLWSPTLSPDELEVLYMMNDQVTGRIGIDRSVRESRAMVFPPGQPVAELDAAASRCPPARWIWAVDLSADGLTAYVGCWGESGPAPLLMARRTRIGAPFTLDAQEYGTVGAALSVSPDELVVYGEGYTMVHCCTPPVISTRSSTSAKFGPFVHVPGFETATLGTPEPSPDGLWLYGAFNLDVVEARRERLDAPFGAPAIVAAGVDDIPRTYARDPEISRDCRRLYYVNRIDTNPAVGRLITSIRVVER